MTISADYAPNIDVGNGVSTSFAVNFPFASKSDLQVTLFNVTAGADVVPAPILNGGGALDYTVSGTADPDTGIFPSGTVVLNTAPPATYKVVRARASQQRQNTSLIGNGPFPAKTVEGAFDRQEMQLQERADELNRTVTAPAVTQPVNMEIPNAFFDGGKLLSYDNVNKVLTVTDPSVTAAQAAAAVAVAAAATVSQLWQRPIKGRRKTPPPSGTVTGDRYLVHAYGPTGAWAALANQVVEWSGAAWLASGAPLVGQTINMNGVVYAYQLGIEDEAAAGSYFWRPMGPGDAPVPEGAALYAFGDSIVLVPDTAPYLTNSWPARFARNLGLALTNDGVSGTGFWSAAWHLFARPKMDPRKGNNINLLATGHNNALQTASLTAVKAKAFHETFAMLCHAFGDFTPASSGGLTTTGVWTTDAGDGLGIKPISNQSGAGSVRWSTTPGSQINGFTFTGENFILHTFRGDGLVAGNRNSDIVIVIDGSTRTPYTDDGLWEVGPDVSHIGHAVYFDNKWGAGTHSVTVQVGANATVARPCYIDGFTVLRQPSLCNTFLISRPLRPTDLTPTTSLSGGTATDAQFDAVEAGIEQACAYFKGYPIQFICPNEWMQNPADFSDLEHPSGAGSIMYARAAIAATRRGVFHASGTYTPSMTNPVNCTAAAFTCSYVVNGKEVTVHFNGSVNVTANNADTGVEMSPPPGFPSDFTAGADCNGAGFVSGTVQQGLAVVPNVTNNTAWLLWRATAGTGVISFNGSFTYRIK